MNESLSTSQAGLEFISKWEGCVLKPYKDIAGLRTIGVGHLIKPGENFPDGVAISHETALQILSADVKLCEDVIKKNIKVELNQNQFDALVSFGFNCGTGVYSKSDVAQVLNAGDYASVPVKLLGWSKARINGVLQTNQGLYNRRKSEGELFVKSVGDSTSVSVTDPDPYVLWTKDLLSEAQTALKKLGLYTMTVDGVWGPGTSRAVAAFSAQKKIAIACPVSKIPKVFLEELRKSASAVP